MVAASGIASEFELSAAPSGVVVSTADLRDHLRYLSTDQDDLITELESMAVERIQNESRRQFLTASWKLYLACFPSVIVLRKCPVASITQIRYLDTSGNWQVLASTVYDSFLQREPGEIHLAYSQNWEPTRQNEQAVEVTFVAGYGVSTDVPSAAIHAVKLIVQDAFEGTDRNESTIQSLINQLSWGL